MSFLKIPGNMSEQLYKPFVVEDDELDRMIMKRALLGSGMKHELHFAEDHESGKWSSCRKRIRLYFPDYNLSAEPDWTTKEIWSSKNTSLIISWRVRRWKIAVEAMKNGANDYIPKSLCRQTVLRRVYDSMVALEAQEKQRLLEQQLAKLKGV